MQLSMLSGLFPRHVIEYFSTHAEAVPEHMGQLARTHEGVTILFMDIVGASACLIGLLWWHPMPTDADWSTFASGFTTMSKEVEASVVMTFLNQLFTLFDRICEENGVHKLETAGEALVRTIYFWISIALRPATCCGQATATLQHAEWPPWTIAVTFLW